MPLHYSLVGIFNMYSFPLTVRRVAEFLDLHLDKTLPELASHGIENHFGQLPQTDIVLDFVVLQADALVLLIPVDVMLMFSFVVAYPFGPTTGFLLDFEPRVDIVLKETLTGVGEMPHLVNVLDLVTQGNSFLQLGGAPRPGQCAFVIGVCALVGSLQGELVHFVLHTGGTERKGDFASMTVREHQVIQFTWGSTWHCPKPKKALMSV